MPILNQATSASAHVIGKIDEATFNQLLDHFQCGPHRFKEWAESSYFDFPGDPRTWPQLLTGAQIICRKAGVSLEVEATWRWDPPNGQRDANLPTHQDVRGILS